MTLLNKINYSLASASSFLAVHMAYAAPSSGADCDSSGGNPILQGACQAKDDSQQSDLTVNIENITNFLLYAIGVVSVIMLIIGGFRYVLSQGDQKAAESARNTILYAIIGIVIAILAFAIVRFVVGQFETGN
ncbi:hypothetical protein KC853_02440 [Candidatus Saccharibacteria bacterium]|nr:hypothetical protein [Candidatus Saccharibacteria bacterium]MCB9834674.1 hypothetical protein [Candidatus Nomurabacteria bacterium]